MSLALAMLKLFDSGKPSKTYHNRRGSSLKLKDNRAVLLNNINGGNIPDHSDEVINEAIDSTIVDDHREIETIDVKETVLPDEINCIESETILQINDKKEGEDSNDEMIDKVWIEVIDNGSGLSYYWNTETNETTKIGASKPKKYLLNIEDENDEVFKNVEVENDEWVEVKDEETGLSYYWNTNTNETTDIGAPKPTIDSNQTKKRDRGKKGKKDKKRKDKVANELEETSDLQISVNESASVIEKQINFDNNVITAINNAQGGEDITFSSEKVNTIDSAELEKFDDQTVVDCNTLIDDENSTKEKLISIDAVNNSTTPHHTLEQTINDTAINECNDIDSTSVLSNDKSVPNPEVNTTINMKEINAVESSKATMRKTSVKSKCIKITAPPKKQKSIKSPPPKKKGGFTNYFIDIFNTVLGSAHSNEISLVNDKHIGEAEYINTYQNIDATNDRIPEHSDEVVNERTDDNEKDALLIEEMASSQLLLDSLNDNDIIEGYASYPPLLERQEFDGPPFIKSETVRCKICTLPTGTCKHTIPNLETATITTTSSPTTLEMSNNRVSNSIPNSIRTKENSNNETTKYVRSNQKKSTKVSYPPITVKKSHVDDIFDYTIDQEALSSNWKNDQSKIKGDLITVIVSSFVKDDENMMNIYDKTNDTSIEALSISIQDKFLANSNIDDIKQAAIALRRMKIQEQKIDLKLMGPLSNYPSIKSPRNQKSSNVATSPIQKRYRNIIGSKSTCLTFIPQRL